MLKVLQAMSDQPMTLRAISDAAKLPKMTTWRALDAMKRLGLVRRITVVGIKTATIWQRCNPPGYH